MPAVSLPCGGLRRPFGGLLWPRLLPTVLTSWLRSFWRGAQNWAVQQAGSSLPCFMGCFSDCAGLGHGQEPQEWSRSPALPGGSRQLAEISLPTISQRQGVHKQGSLGDAPVLKSRFLTELEVCCRMWWEIGFRWAALCPFNLGIYSVSQVEKMCTLDSLETALEIFVWKPV